MLSNYLDSLMFCICMLDCQVGEYMKLLHFLMIAGYINSKARFLHGDAVKLRNFSAKSWLYTCAPQPGIKTDLFCTGSLHFAYELQMRD